MIRVFIFFLLFLREHDVSVLGVHAWLLEDQTTVLVVFNSLTNQVAHIRVYEPDLLLHLMLLLLGNHMLILSSFLDKVLDGPLDWDSTLGVLFNHLLLLVSLNDLLDAIVGSELLISLSLEIVLLLNLTPVLDSKSLVGSLLLIDVLVHGCGLLVSDDDLSVVMGLKLRLLVDCFP